MGLMAFICKFSEDMGAGKNTVSDNSRKENDDMSSDSLSKYLPSNFMDVYDVRNSVIDIEKYLSPGSSASLYFRKTYREDIWDYPDGTRHTSRSISFESSINIHKAYMED